MQENRTEKGAQDAGAAAEINQGWAMLRAGDHRSALALAERLLDEVGETPKTLQLAGETHFARANFTASERLARRSCEQFPEDPGGPILRCRALLALGRIGEARDLALETAEKEIADDAHVEILVTVLSGCMRPDVAYPLCKKAVDKDPYNAAAHRRLALTCRLIGRLDEAVEAADIALRFDAHDYEMLGLRSSLRAVTVDSNHIAELEAILAAGCRNALGAARVSYALGKEFEDIGEFERAFAHIENGARLKRQTMRYDIAQDIDTMREIETVFSADALSKPTEGFNTDEPIFVLGLPRTGSTLVERILSSHSAIYAAGELQHFPAALMQEVHKLGALSNYRDLVQKSLAVDAEVVGRSYLERSRPFTGHTPYFIDKLPNNYLSIGIIRRALPNAKIIHVRRGPMDACYAAFKFLFNEAHAWSYDLDEIARYYIAYRRLMDHWRSLFPDDLIEVAYEEIIADLEGGARRLVAELGLDWENACVEFHENTAAAMTGSAAQVRQKIYSSSVNRWRDYESQLRPVMDALEAAGIDPLKP